MYNAVTSEYGGPSFNKDYRMSLSDWESLAWHLEFVFSHDDPCVIIQGVRYHDMNKAKVAIDQEIIYLKLELEARAPVIEEMSKMIMDDIVKEEKDKFQKALDEMYGS